MADLGDGDFTGDVSEIEVADDEVKGDGGGGVVLLCRRERATDEYGGLLCRGDFGDVQSATFEEMVEKISIHHLVINEQD